MGRPKAWLPFGEELMLQRVVRLVSTVADPVVVVAAPDQSLPPLPPEVVIARDPFRGRGPLQGLAAGFREIPESVDLCYASGTDVPFFKPEWARFLESLIGVADLVIPSYEGRHHPLAALYRRSSALPAIEVLLSENRLRPVYLMELLRTREVSEAELRGIDRELATLRNLNTPEEYQAALEDAGLTARAEAADPDAQPRRRRIQVELFGVPRQRAGVSRLWVEGNFVGEALRSLAEACPGLSGTVLTPEGALKAWYAANINGGCFVTDPGTPLEEGDTLLLLSIDAGG